MPTAARRTHFGTISEARAHMKELIDAAMEGTPASMRRETARAAVVDAGRLRATLSTLPSLRPEAVAEAGGWSLFINGTPIAGDGATFDDAVAELIDALRGYAEDWDRLHTAPNHRDNWALVQLVELSDDTELRTWVTGSRPE